MNPVRALSAENGVFTAQLQQIAMQRHIVRVRAALFRLQFALLKGRPVVRQAHSKFRMPIRDAWKLIEKFAAAFLDPRSQLFLMIGKIEEWRRCTVFLSLEKHRGTRHEKQQGSDSPEPAGAGQFMKTRTVS